MVVNQHPGYEGMNPGSEYLPINVDMLGIDSASPLAIQLGFWICRALVAMIYYGDHGIPASASGREGGG